MITEVNPKEIQLDNILARSEGKFFSQKLAAAYVGGKGRLMKLIEEGKVYAFKKSDAKNSKYQCHIPDVLRHCARAAQ